MVAVISYTGFDMEDAMIINKSAYERGFGHASVYKTEVPLFFTLSPLLSLIHSFPPLLYSLLFGTTNRRMI